MIAMLEVAKYSSVEALRNERQVEIRALRPDDQADLIAAFGRTSSQSRYRRFFALKRGFTEEEIAFYLSIDFINHVALVAVVDEGRKPMIIGAGRYIAVQNGKADAAFA